MPTIQGNWNANHLPSKQHFNKMITCMILIHNARKPRVNTEMTEHLQIPKLQYIMRLQKGLETLQLRREVHKFHKSAYI